LAEHRTVNATVGGSSPPAPVLQVVVVATVGIYFW